MKHRQFNYLDITFENTEGIILPAWAVQHFHATNIHEDIRKTANGQIASDKVAGKVVLVIAKKADKAFSDFGLWSSGQCKTIFERIRMNDIVRIAVVYRDPVEYKDLKEDEYDEFNVLWDNNDIDEYNTFQKTYVDDEGNLYIKIEGRQ